MKHWTQTPEGKLRMAAVQKLAWKNRRLKELRKLAHKKTRETKSRRVHISLKDIRARRNGVSVTIEGPDSMKALNELISNAEWDKMDVRIRIDKHHD